MNILIPIIVALPIFFLGYKLYAKYIARVFGEDDKNPTPAVAINDGVDYCPTKPIILFGHHFASIAGAGPIIGPTVALAFGFIPVWLWIVLGCIFIGAVHDFTALFASIREKGKSIAEIAKGVLGKPGFLLFIGFTILMLLTVTSAFLNLTAIALTSLVPLHILGLPEDQTLLKVIGDKAQIGGIASTSVIIITALAPFLGFLVYKKGINPIIAAVLAIIICLASINIGLVFPVSLTPETWMIILTIYTVIAAGIPVWIILQPRDFTNSFLLYAGILGLFLGSIVCGIKGMNFSMPSFNIQEGTQKLGLIWPFLFITVACGAISGFHCLVAGGTTSKQIMKETQVKKVGYGGMLLEGMFALGVLIAVASLDLKHYFDIVFPADPTVKSNPVLAFSLSMGNLLNNAFGIPNAYGCIFGILLVEGFVITSLDTAIRLNRYLFEELWANIFKSPPKFLKSYTFNSFLSAGLMFLLAYHNTFLKIWPVFGSANQLLAALALIAVSVWLINKGKKYWFTIIPAIFMMLTTICSLGHLLVKKYLPAKNYTLLTTDVLLIILAIGVIWLSVKKGVSVRLSHSTKIFVDRK